VEFVAETFVFTSNKAWPEWYSEDLKTKTDNFAALRRRINDWGTDLHIVKMVEEDLAIIPEKRRALINRMVGTGGETVLGFA